MWTRQHRKSPLRYAWFPALAAVLCFYFYYHAVHGRYGLEASAEYAQQIASLEEDLSVLEGGRARLEERTVALRDGSLERDMIDEQARSILGVAGERQLILLHNTN
ncbi:MAG: septum formation initiator family protein [Pseudomonadota bacterium]